MVPSRPRRRLSKDSPANPDARATFGRNIQAARLAQNRTQQDIATAAGVSREYISIAEAGQGNLTLDTMERIAVALNVELGDLLRKPTPE